MLIKHILCASHLAQMISEHLVVNDLDTGATDSHGVYSPEFYFILFIILYIFFILAKVTVDFPLSEMVSSTNPVQQHIYSTIIQQIFIEFYLVRK